MGRADPTPHAGKGPSSVKLRPPDLARLSGPRLVSPACSSPQSKELPRRHCCETEAGYSEALEGRRQRSQNKSLSYTDIFQKASPFPRIQSDLETSASKEPLGWGWLSSFPFSSALPPSLFQTSLPSSFCFSFPLKIFFNIDLLVSSLTYSLNKH